MAEQREKARIRRINDAKELLGVVEAGPEILTPAKAHAQSKAITAILPDIVQVPLTMAVPCGRPRAMEDCMGEYGVGTMVSIASPLAELVTPHSWVARADGESMDGSYSHNIRDGDLLLMTPLYEYPKPVTAGLTVLAKLNYKDGSVVCTLKQYTGERLRANNTAFEGVDFGPDLTEATVWAVCRGVLPKVFG